MDAGQGYGKRRTYSFCSSVRQTKLQFKGERTDLFPAGEASLPEDGLLCELTISALSEGCKDRRQGAVFKVNGYFILIVCSEGLMGCYGHAECCCIMWNS
jgi:hypothetical protein